MNPEIRRQKSGYSIQKLIVKYLFLFAYLLTAHCSLLTGFAWCQAQIDADDPYIQYVGRVRFTDPKVPVFDWDGVYIRAVFEGTSLSLRIQQTGIASYNVFIDNQLASIVVIYSTQTVYTAAQGLVDSSHTVLITKRTENDNSSNCMFRGFILDTGKSLLPPPPGPSRRIEIIGDSFSAGYGNEATNTSENYTRENSYLAYGPVIARHFNADYHLTAWSGMGILSTMADHTMPDCYGRTIAKEDVNDWNFNSWVPDAVILYLGLNDGVEGSTTAAKQFEDGYFDFLNVIRSKYAIADIFCVWNSLYDGSPTMDCINNAITRAGDAKIHALDYNLDMDGYQTHDYRHPNVAGDQKIADILIPLMNDVLHWDVDTSSPSAPATVRDGTGADVSTTTSKIQLSANWDASTDIESGIASYKYAIGTTPGGTGVVNWSDNGTATAVTKTGLTLTANTKYYFSIKAVNGASLQSTATNSNGQTVMETIIVPPPSTGTVVVGITAYPNPYSLSGGQEIKFSIGGQQGGEVRIYAANGKLVRKLTVGNGTDKVIWDGKNEDGEKVIRDLYIYTITDAGGTKTTGKIAVTK